MLHRNFRLQISGCVSGLVGLGLAAGQANASGFALIEQSISGMGSAYAGVAATANSVDTLYFNPAGMTQLPGTQTGAAVHLVRPTGKFKNQGTTSVTGAPIAGGNGGDNGGLAAVPHGYLTHQLNDSTWLGLAINVPFGLTTEYDSGWVGRYHAIKSQVQTVNINPSIAFQATDRLSLAAGISAMYLDGEFTNAIDFGLVALGPAGTGAADGRSRIEGDSWGWGYNLGALFEVSENTRIGIHFRSEVEHNIKGDVNFNVPITALQPAFSDSTVRSDVDLPASVSISGVHQLNPEWAVMADYTWTGWSSIPELRFRFDSGLPDGVTTFDWKDTSRVAIGSTYDPTGSPWTYRFGVAFDEAPIKNAETRTARLPDADRIWVTVGAGYQHSKNLKFNVGYAHLFIDDPRITKTATGEDLSRGALRGTFDSSVDILSVGAEYSF